MNVRRWGCRLVRLVCALAEIFGLVKTLKIINDLNKLIKDARILCHTTVEYIKFHTAKQAL